MYTINTDRLQTILGALEGFIIGASGVIYAAISAIPKGGTFDWRSPVLWGALVLGGIRGIKSYFAKGIDTPPTPPIITSPVEAPKA